MAISQQNRPIRVTLGDLDPETYLLTGFKGREAMSELFEFKLDLVAEVDAPLDFTKVLGQPAMVEFEHGGGKPRIIRGVISKMSQGRKVDRFISYKAELVPPLWFLLAQQRSGIFQQKTTGAIIESILKTIDGLQLNSIQLTKTYFPRNFCAQYRETDVDFIMRLMEDEGFYFYFDHSGKKPEMVVSDSLSKNRDLPAGKPIRFQEEIANGRGELVTEWSKSQTVFSATIGMTDHNFALPTNPLMAQAKRISTITAGTVKHDLSVGALDGFLVTDAPGGYAHWRDVIDQNGAARAADMDPVFDDASRIAIVQRDRIQALAVTIEGASTVAGLTPGFMVTLENHFDADGDYLLTSVEHDAVCGAAQSGEPVAQYSNKFTCIPATVEFKPQYEVARPYISGTQTAVVIGTDGEEIEPDKFGRVKVNFRWDPRGSKQLESSCWVRVAQFWAGRQWGAQFIPRIGDEVVVAFEEGDPDKPMILGSVYNADNLPIYELPKNKTQSGIKTTSSPKGSTANFNEIKFEDKKGAEFISIHAEHNMMTTVENSNTISVGSTSESSGSDTKKTGLLSTTVYGDMSTTVTKGDMHETIKAGNFTRDVVAGTSTTNVCSDVIEKYDASQTTTVGTGQATHVTKGQHGIEVHGGDAVLKVDAGNRFVDVTGFYQCLATDHILLKCGGSSIEIKPDSITLISPKVHVQGGDVTEILGGGASSQWKGNKATLTGSAGVTISNGPITITGSTVDIKGTPVKVNC